MKKLDEMELKLEVTTSERTAFENTRDDFFLGDEELLMAAYVPAKENLSVMMEELHECDPAAVLEGRSVMLDFSWGIPQLSITIDKTTIYPVNVQWITNVYREDAIVKAIDTILGVKHRYVPSEWRENSFYEWKI